MLWIGPTSSVFDITTYLLMYFVICPLMCGGLLFHQITDPAVQAQYIAVFQAGWFVESMWSQTLVIHMIRTPKIPVFPEPRFGIGNPGDVYRHCRAHRDSLYRIWGVHRAWFLAACVFCMACDNHPPVHGAGNNRQKGLCLEVWGAFVRGGCSGTFRISIAVKMEK
ncbi:MAG: hypothetical protein QM795_15670 [Pseudoxanthomonas sp.]